jgi:alpha-N-arabinofuranosidase
MAIRADLTVFTERSYGEIDPRIYGQYLENVEPDDRVIYDGVSDYEGNLNEDVIATLREMGVPQIRFGGNYNDVYRWMEGIGPRDQRPVRPNYFWGKGEENNQFGTDEFLTLCERLDAEAFISINMGTGNLLEALSWLEYCNYPGKTTLTDLRRANGRAEPWNVPIWGIGNEAWGSWETCFDEPDVYARKYNMIAQYMRKLDPSVQLVAVGHTHRDWNKAVLTTVARMPEYLSIHMYGHSFIDRDGNYEQLVALPVAFERQFRDVVEDLHTYASDDVKLALDEWNVRHLVNGKLTRKSPRRAQDALFVAGVFNVMHRHAANVATANYVTMVNGNAPIRTADGQVVRTPLFDVYRLYQKYLTGTALVVDVASHGYTATPFDRVNSPHGVAEPVYASYVDASASRRADGSIAVVVINRHASEACTVTLNVEGWAGARVSEAQQQTSTAVENTSATVTPVTGSVTSVAPTTLQVEVPAHSLTWLVLQG